MKLKIVHNINVDLSCDLIHELWLKSSNSLSLDILAFFTKGNQYRSIQWCHTYNRYTTTETWIAWDNSTWHASKQYKVHKLSPTFSINKKFSISRTLGDTSFSYIYDKNKKIKKCWKECWFSWIAINYIYIYIYTNRIHFLIKVGSDPLIKKLAPQINTQTKYTRNCAWQKNKRKLEQ